MEHQFIEDIISNIIYDIDHIESKTYNLDPDSIKTKEIKFKLEEMRVNLDRVHVISRHLNKNYNL